MPSEETVQWRSPMAATRRERDMKIRCATIVPVPVETEAKPPGTRLRARCAKGENFLPGIFAVRGPGDLGAFRFGLLDRMRSSGAVIGLREREQSLIALVQ